MKTVGCRLKKGHAVCSLTGSCLDSGHVGVMIARVTGGVDCCPQGWSVTLPQQWRAGTKPVPGGPQCCAGSPGGRRGAAPHRGGKVASVVTGGLM